MHSKILPASFDSFYTSVQLARPTLEGRKLPVVYHPSSNITFWGLEKLHPFDSCKFSKILANLRIPPSTHIEPLGPISRSLLERVHTPAYLNGLESSSFRVAQVTELVPLAFLPSFVTRRKVVRPMQTMAAGTVLSTALAAKYGWAIHLGGGMHHASRGMGMGWCMYGDWRLALNLIREASGGAIRRVLYVDLDVHQGNGVSRDKLDERDADMVILDVFNSQIFPLDHEAEKGVDIAGRVKSGCDDGVYLAAVRDALDKARAMGPFDLIMFNAGTDILAGDPLGRLRVSAAGILQRDEMVWSMALESGTPIVHALSGGYSRDNYRVVADSLNHLLEKFELVRRADERKAELGPVGEGPVGESEVVAGKARKKVTTTA